MEYCLKTIGLLPVGQKELITGNSFMQTVTEWKVVQGLW